MIFLYQLKHDHLGIHFSDFLPVSISLEDVAIKSLSQLLSPIQDLLLIIGTIYLTWLFKKLLDEQWTDCMYDIV